MGKIEKNLIPDHITVKLLKTKDKEKTLQRTKIMNGSRLLETMQVKMQQNYLFKML